MPLLDRRALLVGAAAAAAAAIAAPAAARAGPHQAACDYIAGMHGLGFALLAGPPGRWWEGEPDDITPAQRAREAELRAGLAAMPGARGAVREELELRGLVAGA